MATIEFNWVIIGILLTVSFYLGVASIKFEKEKVRKLTKFVSIENYITFELENILNRNDISNSKKESVNKVINLLRQYKLKDLIVYINKNKDKKEEIDNIIETLNLIDDTISKSNK